MLEKICQFISKYIAIIVLVVAIVAVFYPNTFSWIAPSAINYMLGVIMFGMGLILKLNDFKIVFSRPKEVTIGCLAQFTIMPLIAWTLTKIFSLSDDIAIGVVLVGCCPGGTASNVITFLAKGDLALSVGMTCVSTILAPILTPFLTWLLVGASVNVDVFSMFWSIIKVVILPILIGLLIRYYFNKQAEQSSKYLPSISSIVIALIVGSVVSANTLHLQTAGIIVFAVVIVHNISGFAFGFLLAKIFKLSMPKRIAVSIEVGMQNSGLACSLAQVHFALMPLAAVPGAIFSVWHNISGAILARIVSRSK